MIMSHWNTSHRDRGSDDLDIVHRFVVTVSLDLPYHLDCPHPTLDPAEDRVLAVQPLGRGQGYEELTAIGVGAAVGVVPAIFTFGLSIPIGAFIGGAFGLCAGIVIGGSAGLVSGGAVGYCGYRHRDDIKGAVKGVSEKAKTYANTVVARLLASKDYAMSVVS